MIYDFLESNYKAIISTLQVVSICWALVLIAISIDLLFGIKKAKQLGEARTSEGFRRTINKSTYYFAVMFFALMADTLDVFSPVLLNPPLAYIPFVTVFATLGLVLTEVKSVRENAEDKLRRKADESLKDLLTIVAHRQDILNAAKEIIATQNEKEEKESK